MSAQPISATVFAYQVGFGDCFLLRFSYASEPARHVLIDFGTTGLPEHVANAHLLKVAEDIKAKCAGKLDAVVATHRHADHISGFAISPSGGGPGAFIKSLKPTVVVQPWTEDLKLAVDATGPAFARRGAKAAARSLVDMQAVAAQIVKAVKTRERAFTKNVAGQLRFIGEDNLSNASAVKNLAAMGKRHVYAFHGGPSGLESVLPGVKVHVLGPPTLKQSDSIRKQRSRHETEYWHLQRKRLADGPGSIGQGTPMFPDHVAARGSKLPAWSRWLAYRVKLAQGEQLLQIVRTLDKQMNNTSLILLFETSGKKLLFPGDAQIENWSFALSDPAIVNLLADVDLYKVGHHGSLNATPKSMWNAFKKKGSASAPDRMKSVLSTLPDRHGHEHSNTEVPRRTLLAELDAKSELHSTHTLGAGVLSTTVELTL